MNALPLPLDCIAKISDEVVKYNFAQVLNDLICENTYTKKWGLDDIGQAELNKINYETLLDIDNRIEIEDYHSIIGTPSYPLKAYKKAIFTSISPTDRWRNYHFTRCVPNVIFYDEFNLRIDVVYQVRITRVLDNVDYGDHVDNFVGDCEIVTNVQNDKNEMKNLINFYYKLIELYEDRSDSEKYGYVKSDDDLGWIFGEIEEIEYICGELSWRYESKFTSMPKNVENN